MADPGEERVRMDKWLWAARLFKTRTLAAKACELGRVTSNGLPSKAAREVHVGDRLAVRLGEGSIELDVLETARQRGPAAAARTLYRETEASIAARERLAAERRSMPRDAWPEGRPSKRDRRVIGRLLGRA